MLTPSLMSKVTCSPCRVCVQGNLWNLMVYGSGSILFSSIFYESSTRYTGWPSSKQGKLKIFLARKGLSFVSRR